MIQVHLHPDECREYKYWHTYMRELTPSAVYPVGLNIMKSWNQTKRYSLKQSVKKGYSSREITWDDRTNYLHDIHRVNISKLVRQQKIMDESYMEFPKIITGRKSCDHHYGTFIGCFQNSQLRAYITTNFCGDIAAASQILGHGDYLHEGIMLNVWAEFVRVCVERGVKYIVYSRWQDGHDGLKSWKRAIGMNPEILTEIL